MSASGHCLGNRVQNSLEQVIIQHRFRIKMYYRKLWYKFQLKSKGEAGYYHWSWRLRSDLQNKIASYRQVGGSLASPSWSSSKPLCSFPASSPNSSYFYLFFSFLAAGCQPTDGLKPVKLLHLKLWSSRRTCNQRTCDLRPRTKYQVPRTWALSRRQLASRQSALHAPEAKPDVTSF